MPNNTYNIPFITNNNKFYKIKVQTAAEERKTQNETFWMTDYNTNEVKYEPRFDNAQILTNDKSDYQRTIVQCWFLITKQIRLPTL